MSQSTPRFESALAAVLIATLAGTASAQNEWMAKVRLNELHNNATGLGVLVGQIELDTPETRHVSLAGKVPFVRNANIGKHSTHVASIIAGRQTAAGGGFKGAAPSSTLAAANWQDPDGAGPLSFDDDFLTSMTDFFRVAPTTPIINMSAGYVRGANPVAEPRVQSVADWMGATGYLFVVAAGNEGNAANTLRSPGSGYNVLTVGATGEATNLKNYSKIADFSSRGPTGAAHYNKIDLVAPGTRIFSAREEGRVVGPNTVYDQFGDNDFGGAQPFVSGTSFATPIVSGVAACLNEWGTRKGYSKDPRLMRAVLMNSANKSVQDDAGVRWDKNASLGKGATSVSNVLGTGQLDGFQAWKQYDAGEKSVAPGAFGNVPELGWDLSNVGGVGVFNGTTYMTDKSVRKGTYMTSTVAWNRNITSGYVEDINSPDFGTNNWANWAYGALNNLDIGIGEASSFSTLLQQSNNTLGTSEHSVFKAPKSVKYATTVFAPAATVGNATFAHAWEWTAAPTFTKEYNGTFSGPRGFYQDDGWYNPDNSSVQGVNITKPAFVADDEAAWALCLSSSNLVSQQVAIPFSSFTIAFDFAFDGNNGTSFFATLGGANIFQFDADPNSSAFFPNPATNVNRYQRYMATITDAAFFQAIQNYTGTFELTFWTAGGPDRLYIDNITYVPAPGVLALAFAGLAPIARRRRVA